MTVRRIAIVGRPNVGKSALFNRLARRRIAIVHAQSGVTRDRLMHDATWNGEAFEIVDTGGIATTARLDPESVEGGSRLQVDAALDDAAAVILVADIERGLTPMDEEVAAIVRRSGLPVVVAANKADLPARDAGAVDFERLGMPVFPVSALHNRGLDAMMPALLARLPPAPPAAPAAAIRVAVVGRPNVGKSSYINRLLRSDRVMVSAAPGTTRDSVDIPFRSGDGPGARHYVLIDTAGMRRVGKIDTSVERFSHLRSEAAIRSADVAVLLLDATGAPSAQDKHIGAAIIDARKGCVVLVNKWDLAATTQRQRVPEIRQAMPFLGHCPLVFVSARTGLNVRRSLEAIDHTAAQLKAALPTGMLNRVLAEAQERVQPPAVDGRRMRLYYATQIGGNPPRIRIFTNRVRGVPSNYREYLIKRIRDRFGLEGVPVELTFHARHAERGVNRPR